ncbi:hypothetical protein [Labilithrix luteola]|nr:hypothetical protein [Labilithrix luteola]
MNKNSTPAATADAPSIVGRFRSAWETTAPARIALPASAMLIINLDIGVSTSQVLSVAPSLHALRSAVAKLPNFDIAQYDNIVPYTLALIYANNRHQSIMTPPEELPVLLEEATKMRTIFAADANALAARGIIDGKKLAELKSGTGYLDAASDLGTLVIILRENWEKVAANSGIKAAELDRAEALSQRLTFAFAEKGQGTTKLAEAAEDRQRAFTLFVDAYDQARRAVTFLHWGEESADKLVPSLWKGRGGRGSSKDDPGTEPANGPQPATPGIANPAAPAVANPAGGAVPAAPVKAGMPGGSPFTDN